MKNQTLEKAYLKLIEQGMSRNQLEYIARSQGIDVDHIVGFDDEFSPKENEDEI